MYGLTIHLTVEMSCYITGATWYRPFHLCMYVFIEVTDNELRKMEEERLTGK